MKRGLLLLTIGWLLLSACAVDPCTFDKTSPSCAVKQSESQATISAIDADRDLRATQAAIFLKGQGTKSAIDIEATQQVARAEATHEALRQQATRQVIDGDATKIAIEVGGVIEKARAENAALPYNTFFQIVVFWFLLPAGAVLLLIVAGRRIVLRGSAALTQSLHKRAAMITYGPPNNPQLAFVTFDRETGQPIKFITSEGLVGNYVDLLTGKGVVESLDIPDQMKLAALVEATKRTQAARIASATGLAPWAVTHEAAMVTMPTESTPARLNPGYQIDVVSNVVAPLPQWLDEVDRRLLEVPHD